MFFCFMELGVIWVNGEGEVVDTTIARPWRPSYLPQAPARYAIEADPAIVERVHVGDRLKFVDRMILAEKEEKAAPGGSPQS